MIVVHVIGPFDSDRHEEHFPDGTTDEQILSNLFNENPQPTVPGVAPIHKRISIGPVIKKVFDKADNTIKRCTVPDKNGNPMWVIGHPATVIAVGEIYMDGGVKKFREVRRLKP